MFERFSHYLSYGATDQTTLRDLRGTYQGLVVPGTIAAFQHAGTGGFVLTLSATVDGAPYVIDPRFPLFQQSLAPPKRSHEALADILGTIDLVRGVPDPSDFTEELIETVSTRWVIFNNDYQGAAGTKFAKYAKRLDEAVAHLDASGPEAILAPYLVAQDPDDPWWAVTKDLYRVTTERTSGAPVVRVIAATDPSALSGLVKDTDDQQLIVWVSGLNEVTASAADLEAYGRAIASANAQRRSVFALYGGFFAVLLSGVGLTGASHGIGFGEHRAWRELPRSGPAPPRFYLAALHRYVSQEDAQRLSMAAPELASCDCAHCHGRDPIELEYHDLMKHSVAVRATEIHEWASSPPRESAHRLGAEHNRFYEALASSQIDSLFWSRMERQSEHLLRWADALARL